MASFPQHWGVWILNVLALFLFIIQGLENVLEQQLSSPPRQSRSTNQLTSPRRRLAFEQPETSHGQQSMTQSGHSPLKQSRSTNQLTSPHRRLAFEQPKTSHGQQSSTQSGHTRVTFKDTGICEYHTSHIIFEDKNILGPTGSSSVGQRKVSI